MAFRLGIDTGGTYTDGVIWDDSEQRIITKAKALTTQGNLVAGITNCLQALEFDDWAGIKGVALSTTLAFQLLANLRRLTGNGVLAKTSLTPTDLLHVMGQYTSWDTEAARLGVAVMAKELGLDTEQFLTRA